MRRHTLVPLSSRASSSWLGPLLATVAVASFTAVGVALAAAASGGAGPGSETRVAASGVVGVPSVVGGMDPVLVAARERIERGRTTFRYSPMGSNLLFTDGLGFDELLSVLTPRQALSLGVKVDVEQLPPEVRRALKRGEVDLDDSAVTAFLLSQFAIVGVVGQVDGAGMVTSAGITCALCHSTVDDLLAPGVGRRLDGWANRDLDVGQILAAMPRLGPIAGPLGLDEETVREVLRTWGPGKFDAHLNLDGKAFRPDGEPGAVLIPPAFGLAGVNLGTYEGWGGTTYWNAFVGNHEMGGLGTFFDPRLADPARHPVAAASGLDDQRSVPDLVTPRLADLHFYQLALEAPEPPAGSFDERAAARGRALFEGRARCASCHVPPLYTEPGWNLHLPEEIGIDGFQAERGPHGRYRTTPLKGLWTHQRGGFYHDGRFATLGDVVRHYDQFLGLELDAAETVDLVEFLKSL